MKKWMVTLALISMFGLTACSKASGSESGNINEITSAVEDVSKNDDSTKATETENDNDSTKGTETEEVKPGGTSADEAFDIAVSYANWTDSSELFVKTLNIDKMMISSVMHLPIYKFDTLAQLEQFKSDFGDILTMDHGYDEMPAFNDVTSKYDEKFFDENSLMLVYVDSNSGSDRYGVNSVYCADGKFCIHVKKLDSPDVGTCDMAGWFITVAVPNSMIEGCDEFDAIF